MLPGKDEIRKDSQEMYAYIRQNTTCSYRAIQMELCMDNTCLCIALLHLMREQKIIQHYHEGSTYYMAILESNADLF